MKQRTEGHTDRTISGDTRADWSEAFALVPSLQVAYVWHASVFTREVLDGLLRIGFLYPQQFIWNKGRTVLTRTHYWYQHEPCWYVRKKNAPWFGKPARTRRSGTQHRRSSSWAAGRREVRPSHAETCGVDAAADPEPYQAWRTGLRPFLGSGTTLAAAEQTERVCCGLELDPKYVDVVACAGNCNRARRPRSIVTAAVSKRLRRSAAEYSRDRSGAI